MLIAVLIVNLLLAMLCWWAIWQIWRVRQAVANARKMLHWAESQAESLPRLPTTLMQQQQSLQMLRNQYQQTLLSLRQGQQLLSLLGMGRLLWRQAQARTNSTNHASQTPVQRRGQK